MDSDDVVTYGSPLSSSKAFIHSVPTLVAFSFPFPFPLGSFVRGSVVPLREVNALRGPTMRDPSIGPYSCVPPRAGSVPLLPGDRVVALPVPDLYGKYDSHGISQRVSEDEMHGW